MRTILALVIVAASLIGQGDQAQWIRETTAVAQTSDTWLWVHQIDQQSTWDWVAYSIQGLAILGSGSAPTQQGARDSAADAASLETPTWTVTTSESSTVLMWFCQITHTAGADIWRCTVVSIISGKRVEFTAPSDILARWLCDNYARTLTAAGVI